MDHETFRYILLLAILPFTMGAEVGRGGCSCAVFPENVSDPIIVQALQYNVTCDQGGAEICQQLCIALAQGAEEKAPAMICEKLNKHVDNLKIFDLYDVQKVTVYTKSCDAANWKFTGLKSSKPICCHEGKVSSCDNTESTMEE